MPDINTSRRLLKLSITEDSSEVDPNPFVVKTKTSEGTLITGECERKVDRLEALKYKLVQKQASGQIYLENLSKKQLNLRANRENVLNDIARIPALKRRINDIADVRPGDLEVVEEKTREGFDFTGKTGSLTARARRGSI